MGTTAQFSEKLYNYFGTQNYMVNINQEILFNKVKFPYLVPVENLKHIQPYTKSLFCARKIPSVPFWRVLQ